MFRARTVVKFDWFDFTIDICILCACVMYTVCVLCVCCLCFLCVCVYVCVHVCIHVHGER